MPFSPSSQNPLGLHPGRAEKVRVKMRGSAGLIGNVVYFDLAASDGSVTASTNFGAATNPTSNVVLATSDHDGTSALAAHFLLGVLAEGIADDAEGWCYIRGVIKALGADTSAAGTSLAPVTGSEMGLAVTNAKVTGISLETMADATLKWIAFNGIEGFGIHGHAT